MSTADLNKIYKKSNGYNWVVGSCNRITTWTSISNITVASRERHGVSNHRRCYCSSNKTQITKFMGPIWGPPGSCRTEMGPMLAPWTLLSGKVSKRIALPCHVIIMLLTKHGLSKAMCQGVVHTSCTLKVWIMFTYQMKRCPGAPFTKIV